MAPIKGDRERRSGALELFRSRLPGISRGETERPAWRVWLVLFVCILFPLLVILAL